MHLVEPTPIDGSDPLANYRAIRDELERYDARWDSGPRSSWFPRPNCPDADEVRQQLSDHVAGEVLAMSAVTGRGLDKLLAAITLKLDEYRTPEATA